MHTPYQEDMDIQDIYSYIAGRKSLLYSFVLLKFLITATDVLLKSAF